jgi:hypothetical protein
MKSKKKKKTNPKQGSQNSSDPKSYVARMNQARKDNNETSKLTRPTQGWMDRFGFYSCYSKEKCKYKWDFNW